MHIKIYSEVNKFIDSLESEAYGKTLNTIDLLKRFGFNLGMPHSKKVARKIFELRVRGRQEVRIFYCFYQDEIHLLSGFIKKGKKSHIENY